MIRSLEIAEGGDPEMAPEPPAATSEDVEPPNHIDSCAMCVFWVLAYGILVLFILVLLLGGAHGGLPGLPGCAWLPGGQETTSSSWIVNGNFQPTINGTRSKFCRNMDGAISDVDSWMAHFAPNDSLVHRGLWLNGSLVMVEPINSASSWEQALPGCYGIHVTDATACSSETLPQCIGACSVAGLGGSRMLLMEFLDSSMFPLQKVCMKAKVAGGFCSLPNVAFGTVVVSFGVALSLLYTLMSVLCGCFTNLSAASVPKPHPDRRLSMENHSALPWTLLASSFGIKECRAQTLFLIDHMMAGLFMLVDRGGDVLSNFQYGRAGQPYFLLFNLVSILRTGDPMQVLGIRSWLRAWQLRAPTMGLLQGRWHEAFYEGSMGALLPAASLFSFAQVDEGNVPWSGAGLLLFSMSTSVYAVFSGASAIELEAGLKVTMSDKGKPHPWEQLETVLESDVFEAISFQANSRCELCGDKILDAKQAMACAKCRFFACSECYMKRCVRHDEAATATVLQELLEGPPAPQQSDAVNTAPPEEEAEGPAPSLWLSIATQKMLEKESFMRTCQVVRVCDAMALLPLAALAAMHGAIGILFATPVAMIFSRTLFACQFFCSRDRALEARRRTHGVQEAPGFQGSASSDELDDPSTRPCRPLSPTIMTVRSLLPPVPVALLELASHNYRDLQVKSCMLFRAFLGILVVPVSRVMGSLPSMGSMAPDLTTPLKLQLPGKILFFVLLSIGLLADVVLLYVLVCMWDPLVTAVEKIQEELEDFTEEKAVDFLEENRILITEVSCKKCKCEMWKPPERVKSCSIETCTATAKRSCQSNGCDFHLCKEHYKEAEVELLEKEGILIREQPNIVTAAGQERAPLLSP